MYLLNSSIYPYGKYLSRWEGRIQGRTKMNIWYVLAIHLATCHFSVRLSGGEKEFLSSLVLETGEW